MKTGFEDRMIRLIENLQQMTSILRIAGAVLLFLGICFFFICKTYRSADYLSGRRKKRAVKRMKGLLGLAAALILAGACPGGISTRGTGIWRTNAWGTCAGEMCARKMSAGRPESDAGAWSVCAAVTEASPVAASGEEGDEGREEEAEKTAGDLAVEGGGKADGEGAGEEVNEGEGAVEDEERTAAPSIIEGFRLKSLGQGYYRKDILHTSSDIEAVLVFQDDDPDFSSCQIRILPMDKKAMASAAQSENADETGSVTLPGWTCRELTGGRYEVRIRFSEEGRWKCTFYIEDLSGNALTGVRKGDSEEFVIDRTSPDLKVDYGKIKRISDQSFAPSHLSSRIREKASEVRSSEAEVFFDGESHEVQILITEVDFDPGLVDCQVFREEYSRKENEKISRKKASKKEYSIGDGWERVKGDVYRLRVTCLKEGHYRITLSGSDPAGNSLAAAEKTETAACMGDGLYTSPLLTTDQTPPLVRLELTGGDGEGLFKEAPAIRIRVEEESFRPDFLEVSDRLALAGGRVKDTLTEEDYTIDWQTEEEEGKLICLGKLSISEEAVHSLSVRAVDGSGNESEEAELTLTYDAAPPEITSVNYGQKDGKLWLTVTAMDRVSGVKSIRADLAGEGTEGENGEIRTGLPRRESKIIKAEESPNPEYLTGKLKVSADNFRGTVSLMAIDACGNQSEDRLVEGLIAESRALHDQSATQTLTLSEAAYTDRDRRIRYYRKGPELTASFADYYSGIVLCRIQAQGPDGDSARKEAAFSTEEKVWKTDLTWSLKAKDYRRSCADSPITLSTWMKDGAGNSSFLDYTDYSLVIDDTPPSIEVRYESEEEGENTYYRKERMATVTVKDWNFDPEGTKFRIEGNQKGYTISSWEQKGEYSRCQVTFAGDGRDYRLALTAVDLAGNRAEWIDEKTFTVDRTSPKIEILMNRKDVKNDHYYKEKKELIFRITEDNLDGETLSWKVEAGCDGKKIDLKAPDRPRQVREGALDYVFRLDKDGDYSLSLSCRDYAGNEAESPEENLVIDTTKPSAELAGVRPGETYCNVLEPVVAIRDRNLDPDKISIRLVRYGSGDVTSAKAYHLSKKETKGNEIRMQWGDFDHGPAEDGVYNILLYGEDLAGNRTDIKSFGRFYVNRHGSVYEAGRETEDLLETCYTNGNPEIRIREYSVNPVDSRVIIVHNNEERILLEPDRDYSRMETREGESAGTDGTQSTKTDKSESAGTDESRLAGAAAGGSADAGHAGWMRYDYSIRPENFSGEGLYRIRIESDGQGLVSGRSAVTIRTDNEVGGLTTEFVVDRTPPSVKIGNLGEDSYEEDSHEVTFAVLDNQKFASMTIWLQKGLLFRETKTIRVTEKDLDAMNLYHLTIPGADTPWRIDYEAVDKAGNIIRSRDIQDSRTVLITKNKPVRQVYDTAEKAGKEGGKGALILLVTCLVLPAFGGLFAALRKIQVF